MCFNIEPGLHRSGITVSKAFHQMCIAEKQPIDLPRVVTRCIYPFSSEPARVHAMRSAALPFGRLLTVLLNKQNVPDHEGDMRSRGSVAIGQSTCKLSDSHLGLPPGSTTAQEGNVPSH